MLSESVGMAFLRIHSLASMKYRPCLLEIVANRLVHVVDFHESKIHLSQYLIPEKGFYTLKRRGMQQLCEFCASETLNRWSSLVGQLAQ